jgi:hypothetical protein
MFIPYRAVRDAIYRTRRFASRKNKDAMTSARQWLDDIEADEGKVFFKMMDGGKYIIAWVTLFQQKVRDKSWSTVPKKPYHA